MSTFVVVPADTGAHAEAEHGDYPEPVIGEYCVFSDPFIPAVSRSIFRTMIIIIRWAVELTKIIHYIIRKLALLASQLSFTLQAVILPADLFSALELP